jgi:methylase of polypeptide subunit release factors
MDPGTTTPTTIDFGPLQIAYDDRVLVPRPWTLEQSRWAAELARSAPEGPLLELCCGAGQIGLATIAAVRRRLVCVDVDPVACEYTRHNADLAGLGGLLEVRTGPLQDRLSPEERFAGVIADPPWVPHDEVGMFPEDPVTAIDGGPDGLDLARACVGIAADHLMPGGFAVLQVGTRLQVERLEAELDTYDQRLHVEDVREFERGVLVRLDHV